MIKATLLMMSSLLLLAAGCAIRTPQAVPGLGFQRLWTRTVRRRDARQPARWTLHGRKWRGLAAWLRPSDCLRPDATRPKRFLTCPGRPERASLLTQAVCNW